MWEKIHLVSTFINEYIIYEEKIKGQKEMRGF